MNRVNMLTVERRSGSRRPHLVAFEFVVDGRSLLEHCERDTKQTYDFISPFGWTPPDHQLVLTLRLLLQRPPLLPTGRRELLVCPECADLGCGCISAVVQSEAGVFVWSDFGYENDYDPGSLRLFPMGEFVFPEGEVARLLGGVVPNLTESPG